MTAWKRPMPRQRQAPGTMNKTEQAYADHLTLLQRGGAIVAYRFEAVKFRLATRTFYTPDFMVTTTDEVQFHEVKGHWEDDARVKIKVAAEMFPQFRFIAIQRAAGGWKQEPF